MIVKVKICGVPKCRHCRVRNANRSRGLCTMCYEDEDVRENYTPWYRYKEKPVVDETAKDPIPLPREPTDACPGTEAKLQVMAERARLRQNLHHPRDRQWIPGQREPISATA